MIDVGPPDGELGQHPIVSSNVLSEAQCHALRRAIEALYGTITMSLAGSEVSFVQQAVQDSLRIIERSSHHEKDVSYRLLELLDMMLMQEIAKELEGSAH